MFRRTRSKGFCAIWVCVYPSSSRIPSISWAFACILKFLISGLACILNMVVLLERIPQNEVIQENREAPGSAHATTTTAQKHCTVLTAHFFPNPPPPLPLDFPAFFFPERRVARLPPGSAATGACSMPPPPGREGSPPSAPGMFLLMRLIAVRICWNSLKNAAVSSSARPLPLEMRSARLRALLSVMNKAGSLRSFGVMLLMMASYFFIFTSAALIWSLETPPMPGIMLSIEAAPPMF
mmetsp:Transcript_10005/g.16939  ORF Transcript_10005/g.16939 Transcript_10005/m.16939 type:complete len:238 (-) Transcript_10005:664-1377(-)